MSGLYKKAVVWLGLNEEYPDDLRTEIEHNGGDDGSVEGSSSAATPHPGPGGRTAQPGTARPTKRIDPAADARAGDPLRYKADRDRSEGTVRPLPMEDSGTAAPSSNRVSVRPVVPSTGTVRAVPMAKTKKPQVIIPTSFNDAQDVADKFRDSKPVIVNMQNAERDLARRMIDFSSGLCYGLGGQMEKVAKDVYLLTPTDVEVADEDRQQYS